MKKLQNLKPIISILICTFLSLMVGTSVAQMALLHEFAGGGSDGSEPKGSLILSGSTL